MRILIAEDDYASRLLLASILKNQGHDVIECADGLEAWNAFQHDLTIQAAILDWMMPEITGIELCRNIRATEGPYTYVIMLTAKGQTEDVQTGFDAGADDYLVKPLNAGLLKHRLHVAKRILTYESALYASREQLKRCASQMEQLAEERARQLTHADRMATLGTLAAGMAHEINNPATFISGNAQTMQQAWKAVSTLLEHPEIQALNDPQVAFILAEFPDMLHDIRKGVDRISNIVNGLRSYARQELPTKEPFNLLNIMQEALRICVSAIKYDIHIDCTVPEDFPEVVGSQQQIEQVLINLIVNAAHAIHRQSDADSGILWLQARIGGDSAIISVADNGPGIPEQLLPRVFDPFFTTKDMQKGTGLGLSISQRIIEEHGSTLTVCNRPEGGAHFSFTLPLAGQQEEHTP